VPTTTDNLLTTQQYTTAYGAAIEDFLENLVAQTLSEGWHMVILSRISGGAPRATAIHNDVTQVVVRNTLVDSMNSRLATGH
jgi:hypothetical protein